MIDVAYSGVTRRLSAPGYQLFSASMPVSPCYDSLRRCCMSLVMT